MGTSSLGTHTDLINYHNIGLNLKIKKKNIKKLNFFAAIECEDENQLYASSDTGTDGYVFEDYNAKILGRESTADDVLDAAGFVPVTLRGEDGIDRQIIRVTYDQDYKDGKVNLMYLQLDAINVNNVEISARNSIGQNYTVNVCY